jgi:hypothetical protein
MSATSATRISYMTFILMLVATTGNEREGGGSFEYYGKANQSTPLVATIDVTSHIPSLSLS